MSSIRVDIENLKNVVSDDERFSFQDQVDAIHRGMENRSGTGAEYLGWADLPSGTSDDLLKRIENSASTIRERCDAFIQIGIGGSYLGARAGISFLSPLIASAALRKGPEIFYAGHNISSDYYSDLLAALSDRDCALFVVSKSGTTLEPALGFRILRQWMENKYGAAEASRRIVAATDPSKGVLKTIANEQGYETFDIPQDVGGRFSVLTPVGLLPMAVAGVDIHSLLQGARDMEARLRADSSLESNPAYNYAVCRHLLRRKGKTTEILSSFHPAFAYLQEWWKQLAGESEGKDGKGIFPATLEFTTDLHSMGQWIQEGERFIFETFLILDQSRKAIAVSENQNDEDGLNFLTGKTLDFINEKAYKGTAKAHSEGLAPNLTIAVKDRSAYSLGQFFYFFQRAVAMTGYLDGVNPFDQPGVELYKKNMFALFNKPGTAKGQSQ
ncbi:MAG: glucose-6-phosphate isomerase [Candidatus Nitrohelix vancouverensis]|uniref:Glucose-6-phosphate isomerase n=1 Tax=Candidatus Nitrohelix vancouverensis TaxID=2705534 RepID=A0A7T0C2Y0_9BACT|nr:MAG: glucose-6-phosphate isomerase [Candidatus Nitrohelix vancouverensis]